MVEHADPSRDPKFGIISATCFDQVEPELEYLNIIKNLRLNLPNLWKRQTDGDHLKIYKRREDEEMIETNRKDLPLLPVGDLIIVGLARIS